MKLCVAVLAALISTTGCAQSAADVRARAYDPAIEYPADFADSSLTAATSAICGISPQCVEEFADGRRYFLNAIDNDPKKLAAMVTFLGKHRMDGHVNWYQAQQAHAPAWQPGSRSRASVTCRTISSSNYARTTCY